MDESLRTMDFDNNAKLKFLTTTANFMEKLIPNEWHTQNHFTKEERQFIRAYINIRDAQEDLEVELSTCLKKEENK